MGKTELRAELDELEEQVEAIDDASGTLQEVGLTDEAANLETYSDLVGKQERIDEIMALLNSD